ncbi:MAG: MBL fold metallo-hydrolase [Chloroflexota bacterium]|nr:MBL fold metallo-hydrolase [Chloroflexota bacterium]
MPLKLTVIGSEPAWPSAGLACSGYLLESPNARVLVDCGTGVFERVRGMLAPEALTAVLLSHTHFDHWLDLIPFRHYLGHEAGARGSVQLVVPPGGLHTLGQVAQAVDGDARFFDTVFRSSEYDPSSHLVLADINVRFSRTQHPVATYALRFECGGSVLVFSADTGWNPSLADFARGADLFLCEAAFGSGPSAGDMHLTATQAGELARSAEVRQLVLTHLAASDASRSVELAATAFGGPVAHASAGSAFAL